MPVPAKPDEQPRAPSEREKVAAAYGRVFGTVAPRRTYDQMTVMEDMERRGFIRRPTRLSEHPTEAEGMRCFHLDTLELLHVAARLDGDGKRRKRGASILPV